jgi:pilus assembly protein CpaF
VDLFVQVARFSDGARRITHVTECVGMEEDVVTTQDIFLFQKLGLTHDNRVTGRFISTGVRPRFAEKILACGMFLPQEMFECTVAVN